MTISRAALRARADAIVVYAWPTLLVCALCAGIGAGVWIRPPTVSVLAGAVFTGVVATLVDGHARVAAAACALAFVGLAWGGLRTDALEQSALRLRIGESVTATVVVTGPTRSSRFSTRAPGRVRRLNGIELTERVLLELPVGRAPPQGAVLEVRARPRLPRGPETGFDERSWLTRQGVQVVLRVSSMRVVGRRGGIGSVADRLRAHLVESLSRGTHGEKRALLTGIVLGEESTLTPELRQAFRASGLMHLLAVSGQNIAITALGVVLAVRLLGFGRLSGEALAIAAVLAYALAAGWQPSVVRATVAGCLASLAWLTSRARQRWHAFALGALVLLAWSPYAFLDPGFQLSFAAVAGIFVVVPRIERVVAWTPLPRRLGQLTAVAAGCGLVTAPIVLLQFGSVPLWTIPANVLAEPAMPPLVSLSLLAALVEPLSPEVAASLAWLAGWCGAWIALVARHTAQLPAAEVGPRAVVAGVAMLCVAAASLWATPRGRRVASVCVIAIVAACVGVGWWTLRPGPRWEPPAGLRVSMLDVGQGDAILVETPRAAILVDQGPPEARVAGQLRRLGIRRLSALVLTHPQRDHIGGAAEVMASIAVDRVLDPQLDGTESPEYRSAVRIARERGVPITTVRAGQQLRIGALRLDVLWPDGPAPPGADPNGWAVVLLARYRETSVLLTADAESDVTLRLSLPRVDVLKVAHHGSADTGLPELLRRLRPQVALISAGVGNDYGHPTAETVAALAAVPGLIVRRTDKDGRVVAESDGRVINVRSDR